MDNVDDVLLHDIQLYFSDSVRMGQKYKKILSRRVRLDTKEIESKYFKHLENISTLKKIITKKNIDVKKI